MKKVFKFGMQNIGIVLCILFDVLFTLIASALRPLLVDSVWYLVSSLQRTVFGVLQLFLFVAIFKKGSWKEVIHFRNWKNALVAGLGVILLTIYYIVYVAVATKAFISVSFLTLFGCLFLQQITTGFWEEMNFRAYLVEGYYQSPKQTRLKRLLYSLLSFVVFGFVHIPWGYSMYDILFTFCFTGAIGFALAASYLHSHNILIPMILHFVYDIIANLTGFMGEWNQNGFVYFCNAYLVYFMVAIMIAIAVVFILKEPAKTETIETVHGTN